MVLKELAKSERDQLGVQRHEAQLITERAKLHKSFEYVVNPTELPRVAFGSSMERCTLPMSGPALTPFMRRVQGEVRDFPGPFEYYYTRGLDKRYSSKYGNSPFASKLPRIPPTDTSRFPPIGAYDITPPKRSKQAARPFNIGSVAKPMEKFTTPSPADYAVDQQPQGVRISSAFGSKRIILPAVAIICTPTNLAKCSKCSKCPIGDYYRQFEMKLDLCRQCMRKQLDFLKRCTTDLSYRTRTRNELRKYTRVRYCGFFHDHQGTTAAIQLIPTSTLKRKIKIENYLYKYHEKF